MVTAELEEKPLIADATDGDVRASEHLYQMQAGRIYGLCDRLADSQTEAQDCTRKTSIKAWQPLAKFRGETGLGTSAVQLHELGPPDNCAESIVSTETDDA